MSKHHEHHSMMDMSDIQEAIIERYMRDHSLKFKLTSPLRRAGPQRLDIPGPGSSGTHAGPGPLGVLDLRPG